MYIHIYTYITYGDNKYFSCNDNSCLFFLQILLQINFNQLLVLILTIIQHRWYLTSHSFYVWTIITHSEVLFKFYFFNLLHSGSFFLADNYWDIVYSHVQLYKTVQIVFQSGLNQFTPTHRAYNFHEYTFSTITFVVWCVF